MRSTVDFNPVSPQIRNWAPSSEAVAGYARSRWRGIARKARWRPNHLLYYWAVQKDMILLLYAYAKNEAADLTPKQISRLAEVVKEEFWQ